MVRPLRSSVLLRLVLVFATAVLSTAGNCNDDSPEVSTDLGVTVFNAVPNYIKLEIQGTDFSKVTLANLQHNDSYQDDLPGAAGAIIKFTATDNSDVFTPGTHSCTASAAMEAPFNEAPQVYGQASVFPGTAAGQPLIIHCSSGWVTND